MLTKVYFRNVCISIQGQIGIVLSQLLTNNNLDCGHSRQSIAAVSEYDSLLDCVAMNNEWDISEVKHTNYRMTRDVFACDIEREGTLMSANSLITQDDNHLRVFATV